MLVESLRVELLSDLAAISEQDWDRLVDNSATRTVFQTSAWNDAWWQAFGRGKLLLLAAYEGNVLTAIAPLFAEDGMVFFVGAGGSDYLDFIGTKHRARVLASFLEMARGETPGFVGFRFHHIPDDSPTQTLLAQAATMLELTCFDEGCLEAPALRFQDWPCDKRPPAEKKSLLRHERAMTKAGQLEVAHFSASAQVQPLLSEFFQQHITRWAGTPFPSLFLSEQQCKFYRRFAETLGARGWLRFSRVTLDGQAAAFHLGFLFQKTFLWYKPSFSVELARLSPGEVLLRSLILLAQEEEARMFDFGLGDEPFKQRFATETNYVRTLGLYPTDSSGVDRGAFSE